MTAAELLRRQLAHGFASVLWQLAGLGDDEYLWEPVAGCWSVRRRGDARSAQPVGAGEWILDNEWPLAAAPRVTTVAWRVVHLVGWTDVYRDWTFGDGTFSFPEVVVPGTARDGVAALTGAQTRFTAAVAPLTDADVDRVAPTHWGGSATVGSLVWQIAVEHLHHGAEIGVLRDVRRGYARPDPWPEPVHQEA